MEELTKVFEEKLTDRKEYLDLIAQTRGNNDDLYKKMVQTGEKRGDAFFQSDDNPKLPKPPDNVRDIQPLRRTKSNRNRRNSNFRGNNNPRSHENDMLNDNKTELDQDEEVVALTWAYKVLKSELQRRYEVRDKNKIVSRSSTKKMEAYLRFKQDLEMRTAGLEDEDPGCNNAAIKNICLTNLLLIN